MFQAIIPHDLLSENFEMLQHDGIQQQNQINVSQFIPKNSLLGQGQFGPNFGQNCGTFVL